MIKRVLLAVGLFSAACPALAGTDIPTSRIHALVIKEHPRLAFRREGVPALRRRCRTFHSKLFAQIKAAVDKQLGGNGDDLNR